MKIIQQGNRNVPNHVGLTGECVCGCHFVLEETDRPVWGYIEDGPFGQLGYNGFRVNCPECNKVVFIRPQ